MEILRDSHVDEIRDALGSTGPPTGVMLQIGTRNAQNFELLKAVGQQSDFPVLFKRGMGITLEESLNACEYVASSGNHRIVFGLRGMKTNLGSRACRCASTPPTRWARRRWRLTACSTSIT
jgi:3-deoxy-7-phosphoheptulonate synthase